MTFPLDNLLKSTLIYHLLLAQLMYPASVVSWDFVTIVDDHLKFYYENKTLESSSVPFGNLSALTYDTASQIVYFSYKDEGNYIISSAQNKYGSTCLHYVKHTLNPRRVQSMTYDPVTQRLFWTDLKDIYTLFVISKSQNSENDASVLVKMNSTERPNGIAVDSCRGVIYWTNSYLSKPTIESIKIDGTDRKIIVEKNITTPQGITIDQNSRKIYWVDDMEGIHFKIEYSNLDGSDRVNIYQNVHQAPVHIAAYKNQLYYTDRASYNIFKRGVEADHNIGSTLVMKFAKEPLGIVTNGDVLRDFKGIKECEVARNTIKSRISVRINLTSNELDYCLHGGTLLEPKNDILSGKKICNCTQGYVGDRCEVYVCHNYCVHGSCYVNGDGLPMCRCNNGYSGVRCENLVCVNGEMKGDNKICECSLGWSGERCDVPQATTIPSAIDIAENLITDSQNESFSETNQTNNIIRMQHDAQSLESICNSLNFSTEFVQISLSLLCCIILLLLLVITFLIYKIKVLRRRPRIIKRIIAKKNATPLTIRPNQNDCEITIENCCNMNICETPCFEPENFKSHLIDFGVKDEKKNLLSNINQGLDY